MLPHCNAAGTGAYPALYRLNDAIVVAHDEHEISKRKTASLLSDADVAQLMQPVHRPFVLPHLIVRAGRLQGIQPDGGAKQGKHCVIHIGSSIPSIPCS